MSEHPTSPTAFSGLFPKKQTTFDQWWATLTDKEQKLLGQHNARFVWDAAATAEREACAKMCEAQEDEGGEWDVQQQCANRIRARGNT